MKLSVGGVLESVCTQLEDKSKKQRFVLRLVT